MNDESRIPVLVGTGQVTDRVDDPLDAREPLELMLEALHRAALDCGAPAMLARADSIRVPRGLWEYHNPASWLREKIGANGAETCTSIVSGNMVQYMITDAAREIAAGKRSIALVVGAESEHSKRRAAKEGKRLSWTEQTDMAGMRVFGRTGDKDTRQIEPREIEAGLTQPALFFTLFENALQTMHGESPDAHRDRISALWSRFSEVASRNPNAWTREPLSAGDIRNPSPANKMHAFPYTKRMCSNLVVNQGAAVIVCSLSEAKRHGIAPDRVIYLHAATDALKAPTLSRRVDFSSVPAIGLAGRRLFELAGVGPEAIEHVDLYSCFPAAVQLAAAELGLDEARPLTVTGGLGFAGGPFNSYVLHAIGTMMDRLREQPESRGLITSLGGWVAKHSLAIYAAEPPEGGFRYADVEEQLDALPTRELDLQIEGPATLETFALRFENNEPVRASIACLRDDGKRAWASSEDPALLDALMREDLAGRTGRIRESGVLDLG